MNTFRRFLILPLLYISLIASAWGQEFSHVLLLNSYHYGLDWTDEETAGVRQVLEKSGHPVELHVEYMDTKRLADATHFTNLYQLLTYKYRNTRFSSILVTDNDAFDFLRQYRNAPMFADVPVIFSGVNFFRKEMLAGLSGFTGVAETFEGGRTIGVMQTLHPDVRHIAVIIDTTTTGKAIRKELEPMLQPYAERIEFEFWDTLSLKQMRARLPTLKKGSLVLLMPFARDSEGTFVRYADIAKMVSRTSSVPAYGTYDFYMGHGIVGGRLTNGFAQGQAAAEILVRVIKGTDPDTIPVITVAPSELQFDSHQLQRYSIAKSKLPEGSRILYQSWYEIYYAWVWFGGLLLLTTLFLGWGWWQARLLTKRSVLALQESKEKLLTVLDSSSNAIFLMRSDASFAYANQQAESLLGYAGAELLQMNISQLLPENELDDVMAAFRRSLTGAREFIETTLICKDGTRIIVEINNARLPGGNVLGEVRNITERKLAETALRASHQQVYMLLNSMAEGAYGIDTNGNCSFVNRSFLRILGYEHPEEVIGKDIHKLIHHSYPNGSIYPTTACKIYQAYRLNQQAHVIDEVFWKKDGTAVPVEYWSYPIEIDNVVQGSITTFFDITERIQAESQIKKSLSLLQATLESTTDAILVVDLNNTWRLYNRQFISLWDIPDDILSAKDDRAALSYVINRLEDADGFVRKVNELYSAPDEHSFDTLRFKDGRTIERFSIPQYIDGKVVGRVWSFRDVSARKELEEQIAHLAFYDALTQLPNRRLLNDRLSQAMALSHRTGSFNALMFLDLDNFKPLNDTHGHVVGDLLLIEVASRLNRCVRESDTVARFGGDEFVVILTGLVGDYLEAKTQAGIVAEKIQASLSEPYLLTIKHEGEADRMVEHRCTASIGVIVFSDQNGRSQDDIMKWADEAMYQAKDIGRHSILFYDSQPE